MVVWLSACHVKTQPNGPLQVWVAAFVFKNKFYLFVENFIHVYSAFAPSPFLWNPSSQRVALVPYLFIYLLSVCLSLSLWLVASAFTP